MTIPDYKTIMLPFLQKLGDNKSYPLQRIMQELANHFQLTEEERAQLTPNGKQRIFINRCYWAKKYLSEAGLVESANRGLVNITPEGIKLLQENPDFISVKRLEQYDSFQAYKGRSRSSEISIPSDETHTPEEIIDSVYNELRRVLISDLIEKILNCSPRFFEDLVLDVLVTMGYGGSHNDATQSVGRTGDGGIDGIIKEDKLGLDAIYLQAKRWKGSVGRPEIQSFAGALDGVRAKKGIFITTSSFTQDAKNYVKGIEKKIVLIDGEQLASFMIEYNVGVSPVMTYILKKIDTDYFE
jgi:restriction system protein